MTPPGGVSLSSYERLKTQLRYSMLKDHRWIGEWCMDALWCKWRASTLSMSVPDFPIRQSAESSQISWPIVKQILCFFCQKTLYTKSLEMYLLWNGIMKIYFTNEKIEDLRIRPKSLNLNRPLAAL